MKATQAKLKLKKPSDMQAKKRRLANFRRLKLEGDGILGGFLGGALAGKTGWHPETGSESCQGFLQNPSETFINLFISMLYLSIYCNG